MPVTPENVAPHGEVLFSVFQGKKEASTTEEEVMPVMDGAGTTSGEYRHTQIWHVRRERECFVRLALGLPPGLDSLLRNEQIGRNE
jgi:hypothetical protein